MTLENRSKVFSPRTGHPKVLPMTKAWEPLGMADRHRQPDRAAPILTHQRDAGQVELGDESLHHRRVLGHGVTVARRRGRQPESRVVQGDAAKPVLEPVDDVAVQKRPGRIAVQPKKDRSLAFVDVVDPCPPTATKWLWKGNSCWFTHAGLIAMAALPDVGSASVWLKLVRRAPPAARPGPVP
jgi:hypothetical protein